MTAFQYYKVFCAVWNEMCAKKLVHTTEDYRLVESFLSRIANECHEREHKHNELRRQKWEVCKLKFTEFCREVRLKFGIDLTENTSIELEDDTND